MAQLIFYLILIIFAFIFGKIITSHTKDEWKQGKNWFLAVFIGSILISLIYLIFSEIAYVLIFISLSIISFTTWLKARKV